MLESQLWPVPDFHMDCLSYRYLIYQLGPPYTANVLESYTFCHKGTSYCYNKRCYENFDRRLTRHTLVGGFCKFEMIERIVFNLL